MFRRGKQPVTKPETPFDDEKYLFFNRDVAEAVLKGQFASGYEHFKAFGHAEKRRMDASTDAYAADSQAHFIRDYSKHVENLVNAHPRNLDLAMALAIGSSTIEQFNVQGDQQVEMLRRYGLADGMAIYDLACGSGRSAKALRRKRWQGSYKGADIIPALVAYLRESCPGFDAVVHTDLSIASADASLDLVYAWSLFTHLHHEETYIYLDDIHRALKPGGRLVFSFLEFKIPSHWTVFASRVEILKQGRRTSTLDMFLHRDQISLWAKTLGFDATILYVDGDDQTSTSSGNFGQSVAVLQKGSRTG
jgi:SAM-dependent methyltransferase